MATSTNDNESTPRRRIAENSAIQLDFVRQIEQYAPWHAWADKLVSRKKPLPLRKLLPEGIRDSLLWSVSENTSLAVAEGFALGGSGGVFLSGI